MKRSTLLILIALILAVPGALHAEWTWPPSDEVAELVETNLSRHYETDELREYVRGADAEHRTAIEFLLAWLPPSDLGGLPAEVLIENVELAIDARHEAPWKDEIDEYIFHTYILPHRVTQEPVQRWREKLHELVTPRVADMDLTQAALEVNRFAREWITYKPSSRRDQGPLTTMERGIGRCEEEMIFTICALRSAGIPARYCATPCWCTSDGNHAWTEVYTGKDGGWHYIGSCEPAACLDQAWFTRVAGRTGAVLSAGYGEAPVPEEYTDILYRQADGTTTLNSIAVYNTPGTLALPLPEGLGSLSAESAESSDPDESEDEPPDAYIHTFNWGGPVALVRQALGGEIVLGPGDYLVTAEIDSQPWSALAAIHSGQETSLQLERGLGVLDKPIWLRYPMPDESSRKGCSIEEDDPVWLRHQREIARRDLDRCRRSQLSPEWIEFLTGRPEANEINEQMELAGPLTGDWTSAVLAFSGDTLEIAVDLLLEMDLKDFYELNRENLEENLSEALRVRETYSSTIPDSLWTESVLSPRLYYQEGTMDWWTELPWLGSDDETAPGATELLNALREHVTKLERTNLGAIATPEDTWRSGYASAASARACLVGLLRRHGVPGRAERGVDYVEAWEDGEWVRFVPFEEDVEDDGGDSAESAGEGYLAVTYFDQETEFTDIETWRQTRMTRFRDGYFQTWYLGQLSEGDGLVEWSLEEDEYWLFGGLRNPRGESRFVARRVTISAGDSLSFNLDIGIPLAEWDPADLVQQEWDQEAQLEIVESGKSRTLDDVAHGMRLIILTLSGHESSFRQLSAIETIDWKALGVTLVPIQVAGLPDHPPASDALTVDIETAERVFGVTRPKDHLPLTILLDESDATLIWFRGLRHEMAGYMKRMLEKR